ncbi:hypothetical protein TWF718_000148 [Orbilia javanica]|uniref:RNA-dependent RNA polymerase n=1 Tax=Orbilia javanica TaxID=47235 RepID=A0AAN8N411_9PEZI
MLDFANLALPEPLLLDIDSSQAWGPDQTFEEPSFLGTVPRNDESFSFVPGLDNGYSSSSSSPEFGSDLGDLEFELELSQLADKIESQRLASDSDSQEGQPEGPAPESSQREYPEGKIVLPYNNSNNKENKYPTSEKTGGDIPSSQVAFSWDCDGTEIDFGAHKVSSQSKYEIQRTFQESTNREAVRIVVAAILSDGTEGLTLGDVIDKMKKCFHQRTGEIVSSEPLDPFFNNTKFASEFDDQTQQVGILEVKKLHRCAYRTRIKLKPLGREAYSHRFNRNFGSRFMKLSRPRQDASAGYETSDPLCDIIMGGVDILGRHWEVIHTSDASKADKDAGMESSSIIMFAVSGEDLPVQTVPQVVKWLIPPNQNKKMTTAKYNARVKLGFSRTILVTLEDVKIEEEEDILSTKGSAMTDGCGTATYSVLQAIAEQLKLDYTPSYFQIRHGGRKGLIVLDVENSDPEFHGQPLIKYRTKQIKFRTREDLNIEVVDYARPLKHGNVGQQFLAILHHNGVPKQTLNDLAKQAIEKNDIWELLEQADEPYFIKRFYQTVGLKERREKDQCFKYAGSVPISAEERIIQMVDAGFTVSQSVALKNIVSGRNEYLIDSWNNMRFAVPESTSVKCIPDFKQILREGEVFLQFSSDGLAVENRPIKFLHGKVLVGRAPAYVASDIQTATAVIRPEVVEVYKNFVDCIIFPTVGADSLASHLSGGDYDGDTVLVIWDQRLVEPFVSVPPPDPTPLREEFFEESGEKDTVEFHLENNNMDEERAISDILKTEIRKMLAPSKVGKCTNMHQRISYYFGIGHPLSKRLAELACLLLDAPKQGLTLKKKSWERIENDVDRLLKGRREPFYMAESNSTYSRFLERYQVPEEAHVLDYIKGTVLAKQQEYNAKFKAKFPDIYTDNEVSDFFSEELEYYRKAAADTSRSKSMLEVLKEVYEELLSFTKHRLDEIFDECGRMYSSDAKLFQGQFENGKERDKANKETLYAMFQEIEPNTNSGNPVLEDWARSARNPLGKWNLLKAAALFRKCAAERRKQMLPFTVACVQLCYLKASAKGLPFRVVQEAVYLNMYTRQKKPSQEQDPEVGNVEVEEEQKVLGMLEGGEVKKGKEETI